MYRYSISHTDLNEEGKTKGQSWYKKNTNVKPTVVVCLTTALGETRDPLSFFWLGTCKTQCQCKDPCDTPWNFNSVHPVVSQK